MSKERVPIVRSESSCGHIEKVRVAIAPVFYSRVKYVHNIKNSQEDVVNLN